MAFLGDDDVGILEATLSFVDEYPTDILSPTEAPALVSTLVTHGMPLVNLPNIKEMQDLLKIDWIYRRLNGLKRDGNRQSQGNLKPIRIVSEFSHFEDPKIAEHRLIRVLDFHGDIGDFQGLFQHLDAAYNEVDTVFAANGLAAMVVPPDNVHIREGADGKYLEFCASKTLPFAVRATSEAAWNHFSGVGKHFGNGGLYEKAAKNLDEPYTIIEDFTKELYSNSSRADMKAKQVLRRYVEPDRDIIVLVSRVTAAEVKHKALPGMTYHLRVYAVTSRSPASTPENEMSMLQFCSCISLDIESGAAFDPTSNEIRALNKFLIGNTVGNIRSYQERIENALVDQALKSQLQSITI
ncbi:hypothetical protein PHYBOEH_000615 [Phytophthora boehmeriae]|uniref:Uncharacterized protein n=1 Tax=Phytophthora boehmeriae TaxID=109152 RepID=A0A8T1X615_9STRA|nr:hypothetical protein PHYBOEH_000615 [Phytophthora boehmeriae]